MAVVTVKDGMSCLFWLDLWNGRVLLKHYPKLSSFAKNQYISVQVAKQTLVQHSPFHLPLSNEAYEQFQELQVLLQNTYLQ